MSAKIENSKGRSPYATKQKAPFLYSAEYQRWSEAVAKHGHESEEVIAADLAFRRTFGVPTWGVAGYGH